MQWKVFEPINSPNVRIIDFYGFLHSSFRFHARMTFVMNIHVSCNRNCQLEYVDYGYRIKKIHWYYFSTEIFSYARTDNLDVSKISLSHWIFDFSYFVTEMYVMNVIFFWICNWIPTSQRKILKMILIFSTFIWFRTREKKNMHAQLINYNIASENCRKLTSNQLDNVHIFFSFVSAYANRNEFVWCAKVYIFRYSFHNLFSVGIADVIASNSMR